MFMRFYGGGIGHQQRGAMHVHPSTVPQPEPDNDRDKTNSQHAASDEVAPPAIDNTPLGCVEGENGESSELEDEERDFGYIVSRSEEDSEQEEDDLMRGEDAGEQSGMDNSDLGPEDGEDPVDEDELVYASVGLRRK